MPTTQWVLWERPHPVLDLALNFDPDQLSDWGERIFHGTDGIGETAREATVFQNG
ncbi:hypothetical protein [Streptomyces odontomachi]|uniref:hypothetical protein n=1 Tax=Streptomyces odontomachi TaxID=2944940 RepID=UPI00210E248E|nr:hypothetical protein [Streptomyces sp. ODS25]